MKLKAILAMPLLLATMSVPAFADHVTVDYSHSTNFALLKTYSFAEVHTTNSLWDSRVKDAINQQLAAKGWVEVPTGGAVAVVAVEKISVQQQVDTMYDGFGGGRRFGFGGGMGEATTSVDDYKVGTLVVSMFDANSRNLIWRGTSSRDLTGNPEAKTKKLDSDVQKMFRKFPPQPAS
jgi:Domain of unknown function (DUF4136)